MIIGITGQARNGKDSVADILVNKFGFEKRSFAYPIKEACKIIFGWNDAYFTGELKESIDPKWGISPRLALQTLGTEWGQFILCEKSPEFLSVTGRSLWVNITLKEVGDKNIVISDVRFLHEAKKIQDNSGYVFRVVRPDCRTVSTHASETEMSGIKEDICILNDGSLHDLDEKVSNIMNSKGGIKGERIY